MNSSISVSDAGRWHRHLRCYAVLTVGLALFFCAGLVTLDPYDTGRFSLFPSHGVANFGPRFTAASIARQPEVAAAILGSSTFELIDPGRLSSLTASRFVSLAIHGTGPVEQLAVAHWLVGHHDGIREKPLQALVVGLDANWCRNDGRLDVVNPFPLWLYTDSVTAYLRNLVNLKAFEAAQRRLKLLAGRDQPDRADGYRDYEIGRTWNAAAAAAEFALGPDGFDQDGGHAFLAADRLRDFLPELPAPTMLALVFLPRHHSSLSPPGSAKDWQQQRCKEVFRAVAAGRPRSVFLDLLRDDDVARGDANWWDRMHYRAPVARIIEDRIAAGLRSAVAE